MRRGRRNPPGHHRALLEESLGRGRRLAAADRREGLVRAAGEVFAERGYRRSTTAEIAARAGVSEPILYRHFPSKRELFLACIDSAWGELDARWAEAVEAEPDPARWVPMLGRVQAETKRRRPELPALVSQGLVDAGEDAVIEEYMRSHIGRMHERVSGIYRAAQEAGAVPADRDVEAEAWVFLSISLFGLVVGRLGVVAEGDVRRIAAARERWLLGL